MSKRRFIDATTEDRCLWDVTLADKSKAQCGRRHVDGDLCAQHRKMADKWHCDYCGGNDEYPTEHTMDCARPTSKEQP